MDRSLSPRFSCAVCGLESPRHRGWYLVVENQWLDRIKILAWHPILARQAALQSVCSEQHLKVLLTHWLTHANLRLLATASSEAPRADESILPEVDSSYAIGKLVGELSIHRESLSRVWTGSSEALECIIAALVQNTGARAQATGYTTVEQLSLASKEFAVT